MSLGQFRQLVQPNGAQSDRKAAAKTVQRSCSGLDKAAGSRGYHVCRSGSLAGFVLCSSRAIFKT